MPKVKYTPREGLVTTPGTGFQVSGCDLRESLDTIAPGAGATATLTNYGITSIDTSANGGVATGNLTLPDGYYIQQIKTIVLTADGGDAVVEVTSHVDGGGGNTFTAADAADLLVLIWNGTKWDTVHNTGWGVS